MKKILLGGGIAIIFGLLLVATPAWAGKPTASTCATIQSGTIKDVSENQITTGYDKWGYNYQANMFNGWYDNNTRPSTPVTGGDSLMMKWNNAWLSNQDCNGDNKLDRHYGFTGYKGSGAWLTNHASGTYESSTDYTWSVNPTNQIHVPWGNDYIYDVTFNLEGTILTGVLTDPYCNPTCEGPLLNGTIIGDAVTFAFAYPENQTQGVRTYEGTIDNDGNASGIWLDAGSDGSDGTWSITGFATKVMDMCSWSDFVKIVAVPEGSKMSDDGNWMLDDKVIGPSIWGDFAIIQEVSSNPCGGAEELGLTNLKSAIRSGLGNW